MLPFTCWLLYKDLSVVAVWDLGRTPSNPFLLTFLFDKYGISMMFTVLYIARSIMFFSITYMQDDVFLPRFIGLIISFIASMLLLVVLPNLVTLLIG